MRLAVVLLLLLTLAAPAAAEHGGVHPTLRTERVWFFCADQLKAQNLSYAQRNVPGWDTSPPAGSLQQGNGCGYYENAVGGYLGANETTLDSIWQGTFTGNVDRVTVELHNVHASAARVAGTFKFRANLFIDGVDVLDPDAPQIEVVPAASGTALASTIKFTVLNIGLQPEDGDGQQVRQFRLVIRSLSEEQSAWVWDATEVPAGLTFNPVSAEAVSVQARSATG